MFTYLFQAPIVKKLTATFSALAFLALPLITKAAEEASGDGGHGGAAIKFLWIAAILIAAKIGGALAEKWGQPAVLGELLMGVALGNLFLFGFHGLEGAKVDEIIAFLAELGVVILLFQVGLESNIAKMSKVGIPAFMVAIVGVVLPFVLGAYIFGPMLLPGLSSNAYLFLGATLTATSVGITARVFKDLGKLQMREAQIVLGAAVIDDVLGLIILAVVSAMVTLGSVSAVGAMAITFKAVAFLGGSIVLGGLLAPKLGSLFSKINTGTGMKLALATSFMLVFAWAAGEIGLAPIVGAFAAGLVLDPVHFANFKNPEILEAIRERISGFDSETKKEMQEELDLHGRKHIESLMETLAHFFVPIFFVVTGMGVSLLTLTNLSILGVALGITAIAFVGKIVAGYAAGKGTRKSLVGWGMVPRGEVGLIFATIGRSLGVVSAEMYSVIVIMVILTTLLAPMALSHLLKKETSDSPETQGTVA